MEIALIGDTHFGHKGDSLLFQDYFQRFYDNIFFPTLERRNINTVVHVGDLVDRRKFINLHILHRTRREVLDRLGQYKTHLLVGNHDTSFRDTNEVNSAVELCGRYPNITVYEEPQEILIDGLKVLLVPWLNPSNMEAGLQKIATSTASVLMGHLEIAGFHMDQTQVSEHGLDKNIFNRYKKVFSGHFHHKSEDGQIKYLGTQYQMTFADLNDPKGFHIFDTDTLELEFIQNPEQMFYRVIYDDRDPENELMEMNFAQFEGKMVRAVVSYKTDPVLYDKWIDAINQYNPAELSIKEQLSLGIDGEAEDAMFEEFTVEGNAVSGGTADILDAYVDEMTMEINKERLKLILRELLVEASVGVG